ncbi:MAG: hypothetical protein IAF58_03680 [Leptolyngbya sp.]|nr:hypothetical protein [Candidatus Melainabacteria bacterium]
MKDSEWSLVRYAGYYGLAALVIASRIHPQNPLLNGFVLSVAGLFAATSAYSLFRFFRPGDGVTLKDGQMSKFTRWRSVAMDCALYFMLYAALGWMFQSPVLAVSPLNPVCAVKSYVGLCRFLEGDEIADNLLMNAHNAQMQNGETSEMRYKDHDMALKHYQVAYEFEKEVYKNAPQHDAGAGVIAAELDKLGRYAEADAFYERAEQAWSDASNGRQYVCVGRLHRLLKGVPEDAAIRSIPFAKDCIQDKNQSSVYLGTQFLEFDFKKPLVCDWSIGDSNSEHPKLWLPIKEVELLLKKSDIHIAGRMVPLGLERWEFARLSGDTSPGAYLYPRTIDEYLSKSMVLLTESQYQRLLKLSQGEEVERFTGKTSRNF